MSNHIDFRKQNIPFTMVANSVLYDKNLTMGAKCLYAYLYSKPNGWDFSSDRIAKELNVSKPTILNFSKELEVNGYLKRERQSTGRVIYYVIYPPESELEEVHEEDLPQSKNFTMFKDETEPQSKKATVKKSHSEDSLPISNTEFNNNTINTSNTTQAELVGDSSKKVTDTKNIELVIKEFESIDLKNKLNYGRKPQREACTFLVTNYGFDTVISVIKNVLPFTNNRPRYEFPYISTPYELVTNWSKIKSGMIAIKQQKVETKKPIFL